MLFFAVLFMIALQLRLVVLARRISEQMKLRPPQQAHGLNVEITCDTSQFDTALKIVSERAQIISAAFQSALKVGDRP